MTFAVWGSFIRVIKCSFRTVWFMFFCSCLSPVDFETENVGGKLVVSGQISTIPEQNFVELGRTADTDRLPVPVSGAVITLTDDLGQSFFYQEDLSRPGLYQLPDVAGLPGRSYYIQVVTAEGESYGSLSERIPASSGELTATYEVTREDFIDFEGISSTQSFFKIYVNSILPIPPDVYIRWTVMEAFLLSPTDFPDPFGNVPPPCFILQNADPQRIVLFNGEDVKTSSVENVLVTSRIVDWSFFEKHVFTVYQSAMTRDAVDYWKKVNIVANQVGSIFDTPPAEINGNVKNLNTPGEKVYGYFQAVNESYYRFPIYREDIPYPILMSNCTYDNRDFQSYPARCLDCLSQRNSTYTRPPWF